MQILQLGSSSKSPSQHLSRPPESHISPPNAASPTAPARAAVGTDVSDGAPFAFENSILNLIPFDVFPDSIVFPDSSEFMILVHLVCRGR